MNNFKTIQQALYAAFGDYADRIAMRYRGRLISYTELDELTEGIAAALIRKGLTPGQRIGIYSGAAEDFVVGIIAALKARLVFVPLDAQLPDSTLEGFVKAVLPDAILSAINIPPGNAAGGIARIDPGECPPIWRISPADWQPKDPIYIYFTSGSTGKPNAVLGKNISLIQFLEWELKTFNVAGVRTSQLIAPGFDAFLRDIFIPLLSGGMLCIPPDRGLVRDPAGLKQWINEEGIELIHCVPSVLLMLLQGGLGSSDFPALRHLLLSGEKINPARLQDWYGVFGSRVQLVNLYGATETTMIKTFYLIREEDVHKERIPIGKPMDGARALILDKDMKVCETGVTGQLYIRTPYASLGYYNDAELTQKKFIPNPFSMDKEDFIYATGDLCQMKWDGNIDFIGRMDRQVKIRGVRVEPAEIEARIGRYPGVLEAVVVYFEKPVECLAAFVGSGEGGDISEGLRNYLKDQVPDYAVPSQVIVMEMLPRNSNGKIAYDKLRTLFDRQASVAPATETEKKIFDVWAAVLAHTQFGVESSFFSVGGHSLNMLLLIHKLSGVFKVQLSIADFFQHDTIARQALYFGRKASTVAVSRIPKAEKKQYYPLSSSQRRMYVNYHLFRAENPGRLTLAFEIRGRLDPVRLEKAYLQLLQRHGGLRTSFCEVAGNIVQCVHAEGEPKFSVHPLSDIRRAKAEFEKRMQPFDLSRPTQLQCVLFEVSAGHWVLFISCLDIICDGLSQLRMIKELTELYADKQLPSPALDYVDFSQWQAHSEYGKRVEQLRAFWQQELRTGVDLLELPYDYERPAEYSREARVLFFTPDPGDDERIIALAKARNIPPNIVIHSFYSILLSLICNQREVVTGMTVLGRSHMELWDVLGAFINVIVIRHRIDRGRSFADTLRDAADQIVRCLDNQDYPFEDLVKWARFPREKDRNPLLDALYVYRDFYFEEAEPAGLDIRPLMPESGLARYDLALTVDKFGDRFSFSFVYAAKLFSEEKIQTFIAYFKELMSAFLANPLLPIGDAELRTESMGSPLRQDDLSGSLESEGALYPL